MAKYHQQSFRTAYTGCLCLGYLPLDKEARKPRLLARDDNVAQARQVHTYAISHRTSAQNELKTTEKSPRNAPWDRTPAHRSAIHRCDDRSVELQDRDVGASRLGLEPRRIWNHKQPFRHGPGVTINGRRCVHAAFFERCACSAEGFSFIAIMTLRTSSPEQKARPSGEPVSTMQRHSGSAWARSKAWDSWASACGGWGPNDDRQSGAAKATGLPHRALPQAAGTRWARGGADAQASRSSEFLLSGRLIVTVMMWSSPNSAWTPSSITAMTGFFEGHAAAVRIDAQDRQAAGAKSPTEFLVLL